MSHLVVPIEVNTLRVATPTLVRQGMADFSRLPFFDGTQDVNSDFAFVSEDMVTRPFEDGLSLDAGIHLHWLLPDVLRKSLDGRGTSDGARFPAVPNMWLISRSGVGEARRWIVESDYMHPWEEGPQPGALCFPIGAAKDQTPPYRYMGRALPEHEWHLLNAPHDHLRALTRGPNAPEGHPLTALGYGDPTFAAFYPNCRGVFGFCDPSPPKGSGTLRYRVVGWYRDVADDFCQRAQTNGIFESRYSKALRSADPWPEESYWSSFRHRAFEECFGWKVANDTPVPDRSLYLADAAIDLGSAAPAPPAELDVHVALGNTATEALSAQLARSHLAPDDKAEDRMEALNLLGEVDHLRIDTGAKFREARHRSGFQGVPAGLLWHVVQPTQNNDDNDGKEDTKEKATTPKEVTLPDDLAHMLNRLNKRQAELDKTRHALASMRTRTFADWYRYMLCAYPPPGQAKDMPDIDQARFMIETHDLPQVTRLEKEVAALERQAHYAERTLRFELEQVIARARQEAEQAQKNRPPGSVMPTFVDYELKPIAAPRYWQANEPVVLLSGADVPARPVPKPDKKPDKKPGKTAKNPALKVVSLPGIAVHHRAGALLKALGALPTDAAQAGTEWAPLLMEWEAELWPTPMTGQSQATGHKFYMPEHISTAYRMSENESDLIRRQSAPEFDPHPNVIQGSAILTPHAAPRLIAHIESYLETHLYPIFEAHAKRHKIKIPARKKAAFGPAARRWFHTVTKAERIELHQALEGTIDGGDTRSWQQMDAFIGEILLAEEQIEPVFGALSQALSGFNAGLIGQKQTMQLSVADPLAFADDSRSDYAAFAKKVKAAVGAFNRTAPQPMARFTPLRSGAFQLARLRLLDSFGRSAAVPHDRLRDICVSHTLRHDATRHDPAATAAALPPRLAQPARLSMRWLAGAGQFMDEVETTAHPATTPICGWLVPNELDDSVAVYGTEGAPLGSLDLNGDWRRPPGQDRGVASSGGIENPHLKRVVQWIETAPGTIREVFHSALSKAIENVDPANWAEHEDIALLMGRPIAVARIRLGLDLMGSAGLNPGTDVFARALRHGHDPHFDSAMIDEVLFPVRLGEHAQLNDGLLGYWKEWEAEGGPVDGLPFQFNSPQAHGNTISQRLENHAVHCANDGTGPQNEFNIGLSLGADPVTLTVLIDPRAKVHATSGILPTKVISVPFEQVQRALQAIEVTFDVAPILMPRRDQLPITDKDGTETAVVLPLPQEPGYRWHWLEAEGGWQPRDKIVATSSKAGADTDTELRDGYLVLNRTPVKPKGPAA